MNEEIPKETRKTQVSLLVNEAVVASQSSSHVSDNNISHSLTSQVEEVEGEEDVKSIEISHDPNSPQLS
jgi:hypothetical protein